MSRGADGSGHRRVSTGSSRLQWAAPDLHRGAPERSGQRRTSPGELPNRVGSAGPLLPEKKCRKYVRQEYQKICQKGMSKDMSEEMSIELSEDMSERMSEDMSERLLEDTSDKDVRRYVRKGYQKYVRHECQKIC